MSDLLAARLQMAFSLGFHIIFAAVGIVLPFLLSVSHWRWLKTRDPIDKALTLCWTRGLAIFFATGAVSGTVLSFELGLLWPKFMEIAGPVFGLPFAWEGTAFFVEAICLGLYLYGWNRLPPKLHWAMTVVIGMAGVFSGLFVICANAWMNHPTGFTLENGVLTHVDPVAAMFNPASLPLGIHMILSAFCATGFAVAGLHALLWMRGGTRELHARAIPIALAFATVASLLQPLSGDWCAKRAAEHQPVKLAAMENLQKTTQGAPLRIGPFELPKLLSFLAFSNFNAEVKGLDSVPENERPPVGVVHLSFQIMILIGMFFSALSIAYWLLRYFRPRFLWHPTWLRLLVVCTPLGFIAMEAGWVVTEVGRQPWIIYQTLKTTDSLTPMPGLVYPFILYTSIYLFLAFMVVWLMVRQVRALPRLLESSNA